MRLLYITNARMPTEKAHGWQVAKTIEFIERAGIEVSLFLPSRKNHIKTNIATFYNISHGFKRIIHLFDIVRPVLYISERIYFPIQRIWFSIAAFVYGLTWNGAIYSRDITVSFLLSLIGKRVIYEDHEPKQRFKKLYAFFLKHIPKKVVVAHNLIDDYKAMNIPEESYSLIPNGVDISEFDQVNMDKSIWNKEFNISDDMPVALYVGHFYRWKGVYTLLDSAKEIRAAVVLVGGTKEDYKEAEKYIEEKGITNVYLSPFVPHQEIVKYIKSADVLVLPNTAREERSQKYTTPIKLFEYLCSEVPIVASNIPSFAPYLIHKQNACLFEPDNSEDLAENINFILSNKELAKKIAVQAKDESKQYDWAIRAEKIISFIKK